MNRKRFLSISLVLVMLLSSFQLGLAVDAVDLDNLTQYDMNLSLNTEEHIVEGEQNIIFTNTYNTDLDDLVFHLYPDSYKSYETLPAIGGIYLPEGEEAPKLTEEQQGYISINKVYINDEEVKYVDDNQILKINMEQPLKKGEKSNIKIEFTLKIPEGHHRLHQLEGVYSLTNWYPIISIYDEKTKKWDENPFHPVGESNYSDVSNYNVKLTVPKKMIVAPTGTIIDEKENEENKTITIKAEKVREFVIIMSQEYKVKTKEVDGIKISNYYLDDGNDKGNIIADGVLNEVVKTVKFMNKTVGKYPYDELKVAETYLGGGAMEYPQVIQMGRYWSFEDEINIKERAPFIIEAAVHETMHQWWYVAVGNNEYKEPFLDESLTVFTTAYYFEKEYGKDHENGINKIIRNSMYPSNIPALNSKVDDFKERRNYGETIYTRGPTFFQDLRERSGEEKFVKVLSTYYDKYQFKNATIEGLLNVIEEVAGKDIKKAMEEAVTKPNYFPENIKLTQEEEQDYRRKQLNRQLKENEKRNGLIMGSIVLRALEGEDVIIVKPDYLNEESLMQVEDFIRNLTEDDISKDGAGMKVVGEKNLTEKDKGANLILIGNPNKSSIIKGMVPKLPIKIGEDIINIGGVAIKNENISGSFIAKNPNNEKNLVLIIFLDENMFVGKEIEGKEGFVIHEYTMYKYNPMYNDRDQFIINVNDIEIKGRYE